MELIYVYDDLLQEIIICRGLTFDTSHGIRHRIARTGIIHYTFIQREIVNSSNCACRAVGRYFACVTFVIWCA